MDSLVVLIFDGEGLVDGYGFFCGLCCRYVFGIDVGKCSILVVMGSIFVLLFFFCKWRLDVCLVYWLDCLFVCWIGCGL